MPTRKFFLYIGSTFILRAVIIAFLPTLMSTSLNLLAFILTNSSFKLMTSHYVNMSARYHDFLYFFITWLEVFFARKAFVLAWMSTWIFPYTIFKTPVLIMTCSIILSGFIVVT